MKMKVVSILLGTLVLIALVFSVFVPTHAVFAQGCPKTDPKCETATAPATTTDMFTAEQLVFIGVISSALVIVFRLLLEAATKLKFVVPDIVMIVIVYVVSFAVAIWWFPQAIPAFPVFSPTEPVTWLPTLFGYVGALLVALTAYATSATAIYLLIFKKVKDGLGGVLVKSVYH